MEEENRWKKSLEKKKEEQSLLRRKSLCPRVIEITPNTNSTTSTLTFNTIPEQQKKEYKKKNY